MDRLDMNTPVVTIDLHSIERSIRSHVQQTSSADLAKVTKKSLREYLEAVHQLPPLALKEHSQTLVESFIHLAGAKTAQEQREREKQKETGQHQQKGESVRKSEGNETTSRPLTFQSMSSMSSASSTLPVTPALTTSARSPTSDASLSSNCASSKHASMIGQKRSRSEHVKKDENQIEHSKREKINECVAVGGKNDITFSQATDAVDGQVVDLGGNKLITVNVWRGKAMLHIREYYWDTTKNTRLPTKKGITMNEQQWRTFSSVASTIDALFAQNPHSIEARIQQHSQQRPPLTAANRPSDRNGNAAKDDDNDESDRTSYKDAGFNRDIGRGWRP